MRVQVLPIAERAKELCQSDGGAELLAILRGEKLGSLQDSMGDLSESIKRALMTQARCVQMGNALVTLGLFGSLLEYARYLEEEVGTDGPPQSPLLTSWADGHVLMDAAVGVQGESPLSVVALLAKTLLEDEDMTRTAHSLAQSFPRVFVIEAITASADGQDQRASLRCIFSGEVTSAVTLRAELPEKQLALIRLVEMPGGDQMIFGTPYLLLNRESTWLKHLESVAPQAAVPPKKRSRKQKKARKEKPLPSPIDRLRSYMRRGPTEDYWCEYLIEGSVGTHAGCVQLAGLPHLPKSLPHNPNYAGLLADEWEDSLETDPVHSNEENKANDNGNDDAGMAEGDPFFWEMLQKADAPLKSIWELGSPEPLVILRGILGEICEADGYLETARQDLHEALGRYQTNLPTTELHGFVPVFHAYAALARVGKRRTTAIEMAEATLSALPKQQKMTKLARAFQNTYFSLFQIHRVDQNEGFETLDLLRNRRVYISEKEATLALTTDYILGAWVVDLPDGRSELEGSLLALPQMLGEHVLDLVQEHRSEWRTSTSLGWRVRAARVTPLVLAALSEAVNHPRLPSLVTMDDENICFSTARYRHQDKQAVLRVLGEKLGPSQDGRFVLLSDDELLQASIRVADTSLRVECHSRERLAATKTLLEAWLGTLVSAGLDSFEDGQVALEEAVRASTDPPLPPPTSPEISEFLEEFLLRQVRKTLDEPIPLFAGKTIRELAHSSKAEDRDKARAWLRTQEDLFSRNQQTTETVELTSVWEELALER